MFNRIFKALREQHRLTQQELADKLKTSQRTIAYYESGERHPDFNKLLVIAEMFGVSTDYLLGKDNVESIKFDDYDIVVNKAKKSNISAQKLDELIDFIQKQRID